MEFGKLNEFRITDNRHTDKFRFENIKIIDIAKTNSDGTISKPKHLKYFKMPKDSAYPMDIRTYDINYMKPKTGYLPLRLMEYFLMQNTMKIINTATTTVAKSNINLKINCNGIERSACEINLNVPSDANGGVSDICYTLGGTTHKANMTIPRPSVFMLNISNLENHMPDATTTICAIPVTGLKQCPTTTNASANDFNLNVLSLKDAAPKITLKFDRNLQLEMNIMKNEKKERPSITQTPKQNDKSTKIYARRSTLLKIMCMAIYPNSFGDFVLNASKFMNLIYLAPKNEGSAMAGGHSVLIQNCFVDNPMAEHCPNVVPIDENVQLWYCLNAQLKHFNINYTAEVVGVKSSAEIKDLTNMDVLNDTPIVQLRCYNRELSRCQSLKTFLLTHLINTKDLYTAEVNDSQIIEQRISLRDPSTLVKDPMDTLHKCIGFLYNILTKLETHLSNIDCPYTVLEISYNMKNQHFYFEIFGKDAKKCFLNEEFIQHMKKNY